MTRLSLVLLWIFSHNVHAASDDLLTRYSVTGTWSTDCAALSDPKNVRTTYTSSLNGYPKMETRVGGKLISEGEVTRIEAVTETKHVLHTKAFLIAERDKVSTARVVRELVGKRQRILDTVVTLPDGKKRILVKEGLTGTQNADGSFQPKEPAKDYERCLN